jgi:hypothetical protein
MSFASKRLRKDASDTPPIDPDFGSLENMSFLLMLGMLPLEVHDLVLPPARVIMLLMVCRELQGIVRRPGVPSHLKTQVAVRPRGRYRNCEGLLQQLERLHYLQVSSLQLQEINLNRCFNRITGVLRYCPSLRHLDVSGNGLSSPCIHSIAHSVLEFNKGGVARRWGTSAATQTTW